MPCYIEQALNQAPLDVPDVHPNVAELYRRKVERLTEALNDPEDRAEAASALRGVIEKIVLTPGAKRDEISALRSLFVAALWEYFALKLSQLRGGECSVCGRQSQVPALFASRIVSGDVRATIRCGRRHRHNRQRNAEG
jgi:hypothetical protein